MTTAETVTNKSKANGKSGRKNAIGNFLVDMIDGAVMKDFVEAKKLPLDVDTTDEQLAVALTLHFRGTTKDDDMAQCVKCFGEAPDNIADCPFCGLQGNVKDTPPAAAVAPPAPVSAPAIAAEVVEGEPPAEPVSADKKAAAKAKKEAAKTASTALAVAPGVAKAGLATVTEQDLDRALAEVMRWKSAAAAGYWMMGKTLREINEKQLWKQRGSAAGKSAYKSFESFVDAECHMTAAHAYSAIDIAKEYSEEKMKLLGQTNAMLILKVPAEARAHLEATAEAGASASQIREEVARKRAKVGAAKNGKKSAAGSAGAKARAKKLAARADKDKITIATIEGRKVFPLYKKPETMRNLDMDQLKPAKALGDIPFGKIEMVGDIVIYFTIKKNSKGELVGTCEVKRESSDEE